MMEYFRIPRNVMTICLGKSTYARFSQPSAGKKEKG
jgi:deoxycytidine triphosphate deaminase